ncbi:prephenate dehydratase domain-containing protein [Oerskovia sp. M15]
MPPDGVDPLGRCGLPRRDDGRARGRRDRDGGLRGVAAGDFDHGIVAIENSVEGYVVPSLDAIVGSEDVVAIDEVVLEIRFDAFVRPGHGELTEVTAHPHGLAQCQAFVTRSGRCLCLPRRTPRRAGMRASTRWRSARASAVSSTGWTCWSPGRGLPRGPDPLSHDRAS